MNRWLLALILVAAAVMLLSPGIVGLLAERQMQQAPGLQTLHVERHWFTSASRHRLPLTEPPLQALVTLLASAEPGADAPVALIIATRADHGLLPLSAVARGANAVRPALASNVSTLSLETADGRTLPLAGQLDSRVTLTGGLLATLANFHLDSPAGPVRVTFSLDLPAAGMARAWPGPLLSLSGTLDLAIPAALAASGTPAGEAMQHMLATGFLVPQDGRYRMHLDLASGSLTVNGAPYPLAQLIPPAN